MKHTLAQWTLSKKRIATARFGSRDYKKCDRCGKKIHERNMLKSSHGRVFCTPCGKYEVKRRTGVDLQ